MAYAIGANFLGGNEFVNSGFTSRAHQGASYPLIHARNTTLNSSIPTNGSTGPTVNLFIDAAKGEFAASIVSACVETTVYAIQCTAGRVQSKGDILYNLQEPSILNCGPNALIGTMTVGPSIIAVSTDIAYSTNIAASTDIAASRLYDVKGYLSETCSLYGTTAASCTATFSVTATDTAARKSYSTYTTLAGLLAGSTYHRYDVAITAGAEKTANPTACAKSTSGTGSLNSRNMAIWAVAGVIGVASFLAI